MDAIELVAKLPPAAVAGTGTAAAATFPAAGIFGEVVVVVATPPAGVARFTLAFAPKLAPAFPPRFWLRLTPVVGVVMAVDWKPPLKAAMSGSACWRSFWRTARAAAKSPPVKFVPN